MKNTSFLNFKLILKIKYVQQNTSPEVSLEGLSAVKNKNPDAEFSVKSTNMISDPVSCNLPDKLYVHENV